MWPSARTKNWSQTNLTPITRPVGQFLPLDRINLVAGSRARFVELRRKIAAAKQKEHVHDLESAILKEIQDKHSKVQAEEEEEEGETKEEREKMNELLADTKENVGEAVVLAEGEDSDVEDLEDNFKPAKKKKLE